MPPASFVSRFPGMLFLGTLFACGGEPTDPGPDPNAVPTAIAATSTASLSGTVGAVLPNPIAVRVTDADGNPVAGVAVDFRVTAGGGSVAPAATQLSLRSAGTTIASSGDSTGANGEASVTWTLGTTAGVQTVTASVVNVGTVTFSATAAADVATEQSFTNNSAFIGVAGTDADGPIELLVVDQYGNGVPGEMVTWAVIDGGGSIPASSLTDDDGVAEVTPTLGGSYGLNAFTASAHGFTVDTIELIAVQGVPDPVDGGNPGAGLVSHDVTFLGGANIDGILFFYYRFVEDVAPTSQNDPQPPDAMWAALEFDLDQDTTTGWWPSRLCNGVDSLAFGVDGFVLLDPRRASGPTGYEVPVVRVDSLGDVDRCDGIPVEFRQGTTIAFFRGNTVTIGVDLSFFADDGIMDFTGAFVSASVNTLTDLAPDSVPHTFDLSMPAAASAIPFQSRLFPGATGLAELRPAAVSIDEILEVRRRTIHKQ